MFAAVFGPGERYTHAQYPDSGLGAILPLDSIQKFIGPILPPNGLSSTFRSELGFGGGLASLERAWIRSKKYGDFDLRLTPDYQYTYPDGSQSETLAVQRSLDSAPSFYEFYAKMRIWRLAFNASYVTLDTRSRRSSEDGLFFNGLLLGAEVDAVYNEWVAIGVAANYFSTNPRFTWKDTTLAGGRLPVGSQNPPDGQPTPNYLTDFSGNSPSNIGFYLRYTPPEILNFPVHVEGHYYFPLSGSSWTSYGGALVFRPQIYRFDLSARLKFDRQFLKFSTKDRPEDDQWEADFCWNIWGIDFGVYF